MTREIDIERVLDRWFNDGPTHMPDRLYDTVVDRIDRIPQRRLALLMTRFADMHTNAKLAAAAAVAIAVVGLGAVLLGRAPEVGPAPSPSSTVRPGSTPTAVLPPELRFTWAGDHRVVPGIEEIQDNSALAFTSTSAQWNRGGHAPIMFSQASLIAPDEIRFVLAGTTTTCRSGDVGEYRFALNSAGDALTVTPIQDACAMRQAAFSGEWIRTDCPNRDSLCLGDLEAGAHHSVAFNPYVEPTAWRFKFGALTYTVPDGWANPEDCFGCYVLAKQGAPENTGIYLFDDVVAHLQGASMCQALNEPGVGRTASDLATWLTTLPGLVATAPAPVTVGGLSGFSVDLTVAPAWSQECPFSNGQPMVSLWSAAEPADTDGFDWGIGAGARMRVILLDIGDGRALLIDIEAATKADFDALLPDAMAVIESFQFHR